MSGEISGQLPLWDYRNFNTTGFMPMNFSSFGTPFIPFWGSSSSGGSNSSGNVDSYAAYKKKIEAERTKNNKEQELLTQKTELNSVKLKEKQAENDLW